MSLTTVGGRRRSIRHVTDDSLLKNIGVRIDQRKKQLFFLVFFVVLLAVGLFAIPLPKMDMMASALLDLVHLPSFALLGFFIGRLWVESKPNTWLRRTMAFVLLAGIGYGTELLQGVVGRTASWQDLQANVFGAAVGICWSWRREIGSRVGKRFLEFSCFIFICGGIWFPIFILIDVYNQHRDVPVLSSFESPLEKYRWDFRNSTFERSTDFVTHGDRSLKITMNPARYPSATLYFPLRDWTSYSQLAFDIYNSEDAKYLILKIYDLQHTGEPKDRFHQTLTILPGWNRFKIPLSRIAEAPRDRTMDMSRIDKVQFFMIRTTKPTVFYLDHLRLEK